MRSIKSSGEMKQHTDSLTFDVEIDDPFDRVDARLYNKHNIGSKAYPVVRSGEIIGYVKAGDLYGVDMGAKSNSMLRSSHVLFEPSRSRFTYDGFGNLFDMTPMTDNDLYIYNLFLESMEGVHRITDINGNIIESDFSLPIEKEQTKVEKKKLDFGGKLCVDVELIMMATSDIRGFWSHVSSKTEKPDTEKNVDRLIRCAINDPAQFDEIFTVEVDKPESPLMRKYLSKLAELVNNSISNSDDDSLEDIGKLKAIAYEFAGYKGKDLDTVIKEELDYSSHFRYLLTKGEKIVITEEQKSYFDSLVLLYKSEMTGAFKNPNRKDEYVLENIITNSNIAYLREKVPSLVIGKNVASARYYTYLDNFSEINNHLSTSGLGMKMALIDDLLEKEFPKEQKSENSEIKTVLFICDKNLNYVYLTVKKSTLNKWKKDLKDGLVLLEQVILDGKTTTPFYFKQLVL